MPQSQWSAFGGAPRSSIRGDPVIEQYMPRFDIAEVHQTRVAAVSSATYDAAQRMDLQQSTIVHGIIRARDLMLGATPPPRPADRTFFAELRSIGWGVLEEVPGRRIVFGAVTRPWEANVVFRALPPSAFASFDSAGYVKIVVTIAADSMGNNQSMFRTETRALATDAASRVKFRRYWSIFSPGILLIRTEALKLVRSEAERVHAD